MAGVVPGAAAASRAGAGRGGQPAAGARQPARRRKPRDPRPKLVGVDHAQVDETTSPSRAGSVRTAQSAPNSRMAAAIKNATVNPEVSADAWTAPASRAAAVRAVAAVARIASTSAPPRWVEVWNRPEARPFSPARTPVTPCEVSGTKAL